MLTMRFAIISTLFVFSLSSYAIDVGEYKGSKGSHRYFSSVADIAPGTQRVALLVESSHCAGFLAFTARQKGGGLVGSPGNGCTITMTQNMDVVSITETHSCRHYHGVTCSFEGVAQKISAQPRSEDDYESIATKLIAEAVERTDKAMKSKTSIQSSPSPARIIVNGEFVGVTPVAVSLENMGLATNGVSTELIIIKAVPSGDGCVQVEPVLRGKRIPARMFFDTRMCPMPSSIDLNMN